MQGFCRFATTLDPGLQFSLLVAVALVLLVQIITLIEVKSAIREQRATVDFVARAFSETAAPQQDGQG